MHQCFLSRSRFRPYSQGRSQPHSPGWARVPLSSFFPQISINLLNFPQTLNIFFLNLALRVGESPTREGPGYATAYSVYVCGRGTLSWGTANVLTPACSLAVSFVNYIINQSLGLQEHT